MAQRRMMSMHIIDTDAFMDMSHSAQCLYMHMLMRADDDGFVSNAKKIMRMIGAQDDDLKLLFTKRFVIPFENGVCVIKHWRIHNYIQKDRYNETKWSDEKANLSVKKNGAYTLDTECVQNVDTGKVRLGKVSKDKRVNFEKIDIELSELLLELIQQNTPTYKKPNLDKWAEQIRLMRERDNRTVDQIRFVIEWCQKDDFWQANILSTKKLREKFDTLVAQIKRKVNKEVQEANNLAF